MLPAGETTFDSRPESTSSDRRCPIRRGFESACLSPFPCHVSPGLVTGSSLNLVENLLADRSIFRNVDLAELMRYVRITIAVGAARAHHRVCRSEPGAGESVFPDVSVNAPMVFVILGTYLLGMVSGWGLVEVLKRTLRE